MGVGKALDVIVYEIIHNKTLDKIIVPAVIGMLVFGIGMTAFIVILDITDNISILYEYDNKIIKTSNIELLITYNTGIIFQT